MQQRVTRSKSRQEATASSTNGTTNGATNGANNGAKNGASNGVADHGDVMPNKQGGLVNLIHHTLMPLWLMFFSPNLVILLWYTAVKCDGSFLQLYEQLSSEGFVTGLLHIWMDIHIGQRLVVGIILGYMAFAAALQLLLPGPRAEGPVTAKGHVPVYKDNGFFCYVVTMVTFVALTYVLKQYGLTPTVIYDRFDEFLVTLTVFSHILCIFLHLKGLFAPSSSDCGSSGNLIFDFYWGTELYPRIAGIDIKVFTNCRFGMTVWPLLCCIFALKNYELYGFVDSCWVSCVLQMIYFTKFFWWEAGYMRTIDIMLDRAGFYICWGCLVYVPGVYASVSLYMARHSAQLGPAISATLLLLGTGSIVINYLADKQKQDARKSNGKCLIWGKKAQVIRAKYQLGE